jgi:hypothetical protein
MSPDPRFERDHISGDSITWAHAGARLAVSGGEDGGGS